ncbi:putative small nuclear ribonucleoprotein SmG [Aspergillus melleus]|uniref:putative small nuclear ribonucleoprotein SmG n=1 Tax=Aspergillus melleus TaxID=138277 RepID=UPI001E8E1E79|nr:uncharacterized protein LDX57_007620 [Aspergillus melleus]KAH8429947.1 hypothetical protein LDX57_007620 [Aspergillus melleus]
MPQAQPELKKYMEKRIFCQLNGNRKVIGILRGYDVRLFILFEFLRSWSFVVCAFISSRLVNAREVVRRRHMRANVLGYFISPGKG